MKTTLLKVMLWDNEVGRLMWDHMRNYCVFEYHPDFLTKGWNIAPFVHPVDSLAAKRPFVYRDRTGKGLPPFIADSLPDAWGSLVFDEWAKRNGLRGHDITPLEKLGYIGRRGMGALEFLPEKFTDDNDEAIIINDLARLAEQIFQERDGMVVRADTSLTLQSLFKIGSSVGGRQAKAVIAYNPATKDIRSGQTCTDPEFIQSILKFDIPTQYDYPATRMEMVYYKMATDAKLTMMPSWLLEVEGKKHFMTERYDRRHGEKIFCQSVGAIAPDVDSYEGLIQVARKLCRDKSVVINIFRQAAFNFLSGNTDDHKGNFSFLMDKSGKWTLSPAYDITFTWRSPSESASHCFSLRGKINNVTRDDLIEFAKDESIPMPNRIIDEVMTGICNFRTYCETYQVPPFWRDFIEESLHELAPEEYKDRLLGWKEQKIEAYVEDSHKIKNPTLTLSTKGHVHLEANIDGFNRRYVIRRDTEMGKSLLKDNAIYCSKDRLKELVREFFIAPANNLRNKR